MCRVMKTKKKLKEAEHQNRNLQDLEIMRSLILFFR